MHFVKVHDELRARSINSCIATRRRLPRETIATGEELRRNDRDVEKRKRYDNQSRSIVLRSRTEQSTVIDHFSYRLIFTVLISPLNSNFFSALSLTVSCFFFRRALIFSQRNRSARSKPRQIPRWLTSSSYNFITYTRARSATSPQRPSHRELYRRARLLKHNG